MPAASTHVEFARDILRNHIEIADQIQDQNIYYLGSQGPDVLFFSRFSVLPGSLKKYGNLMHREHVRKQIDFFYHYSRRSQDLKDYFLGFLTHYALDSTVHPIIFDAAKKVHVATGENEGAAHVTIEAQLDTTVLRHFGKSVHDYDVYRYLKVTDLQAHQIAVMYHLMFLDVYHLDLSVKEIQSAVHAIATGTMLLYPEKPGYYFVRGMESLLKAPHAVSGMMLVNKNDPVVLNKDHQEFVNHSIPGGKDHRSFAELYHDATELAVKLIDHYSPELILNNFNGDPLP